MTESVFERQFKDRLESGKLTPAGDGAENLDDHVETIRISCRDAGKVEAFEVNVPDCVGFLLLKTEVCRYREKTKDPYDIYYYCRYSEDTTVVRQTPCPVHGPAHWTMICASKF